MCMFVHQESWTRTFVEALFVMAPNWKHPNAIVERIYYDTVHENSITKHRNVGLDRIRYIQFE